jgi:SAM-dependent methyltransferase
MSDEQPGGEDILELTEAMASVPPEAMEESAASSSSPPLPSKATSPLPSTTEEVPDFVGPESYSAPEQPLPRARENSGVTTTFIRRISPVLTPPSGVMPTEIGGTDEPSTPPLAQEETPSAPKPEPSAVELGIEIVIEETIASKLQTPSESPTQETPSAKVVDSPGRATSGNQQVSSPDFPTRESKIQPLAPPAPSVPSPSPFAPSSQAPSHDPVSGEMEISLEMDTLPPPPADVRKPRKGRSEEDEEELDLNEAEEMTAKKRAAPPPLPTPGGPARPARMRRRRGDKEWWADIFDDDFLALLPESNPREERREVDFIERSLGLAPGSLALDLACGNGRYTVAMARRGYRMVGVDLSLPMLARAGEAAQEADQKINFIHGDMRDLGFDKTFDGLFCVGTSFGYFDDATNAKVTEGMARALKPGGSLLLELANRDFVLMRQPSLTWFEGTGSVCMEETEFNYHTSRLQVTRQVIFNSDGRQSRYELSMRLYSLHEIICLLQKAGFTITRVDGHQATPGAFFGIDSAHIAVIAKKNS